MVRGQDKLMPNKFLQPDKNTLPCTLLAQSPRQCIFAAEEKRYAVEDQNLLFVSPNGFFRVLL